MKDLGLLLLFVLSGSAIAQQSGSIITDRPSQTDASTTISPGILQIESGFTFDNRSLSQNRTLDLYSWGTSWRLGVSNGLELRVLTVPSLLKIQNNKETISSKFGMADLQLGVKIGLLNQDNEGPTSVALIGHLITPTGTEGLSIEGLGVLAKLAVSHRLGDRHSLNYNVGYEYLGELNGWAVYTLAWSIGLNEKLSLFLETYGRVPSLKDWLVSADAGFSYLLNPNLQLDYFFGVGINHNMNFHSLGLSIRFGSA